MTDPLIFHIDGTIEAFGTSTIRRSVSQYSTFMIDTGTKKPTIFNDLFVYRNTNTIIDPGVHGRLFFVRQKRGLNLYAIETERHLLDDADMVDDDRKRNLSYPRMLLIIGVVGLIIAALLTSAAGGGAGFFLIAGTLDTGIPLTVIGLVMRASAAGFPDAAAMRRYIEENRMAPPAA